LIKHSENVLHIISVMESTSKPELANYTTKATNREQYEKAKHK